MRWRARENVPSCLAGGLKGYSKGYPGERGVRATRTTPTLEIVPGDT